MHDAFKHYLADGTARTLEFIRETGGPAAIKRVKAAGNDRFEIRAFRKLGCRRSLAKPGYDCWFKVDIKTANGMMQRTLEGRFYSTFSGIDFELSDQPSRNSLALR
jgi:hypothetical protein